MPCPQLAGAHRHRFRFEAAGISTVECVILAVLVGAIAVGAWKTFGEPVEPDASGASVRHEALETQAAAVEVAP